MSLLRQRKQQQREQQGNEDDNMPVGALDFIENMIGKSVTPAQKQQQVNALIASGIVPAGDGSLVYKDFRLTGVGVSAGENASYEDWNSLLKTMIQLEGSIQWIIGDLILMGEFAYGQTYQIIEEITGRDYNTLRDYVYVARNVDLSVRTDKLTFGHHKLVAGMEINAQAQWLQAAAVNGWSIARMRDEMNRKHITGGHDTPLIAAVKSAQMKAIKLAEKATAADREQAAAMLEAMAQRIREGR